MKRPKPTTKRPPDGPWRPPNGGPPDFGRRSCIDHPVQVWYDAARHRDRFVFYMGRCVVCLVPTWRFDDGENDPRGVLGDHAYWATGLTRRGVEFAVTTCATCANDQDKYLRALVLGHEMLDTDRHLSDGIRIV